MKTNDLKERSQSELTDLVGTLSKELFQAKMKNFTNRLDNTSSLGKTRREIAKVKTILRQKELGIEKA
jgi:large subunit ribosomal protein L29